MVVVMVTAVTVTAPLAGGESLAYFTDLLGSTLNLDCNMWIAIKSPACKEQLLVLQHHLQEYIWRRAGIPNDHSRSVLRPCSRVH